jgi:hypothetical protein
VPLALVIPVVAVMMMMPVVVVISAVAVMMMPVVVSAVVAMPVSAMLYYPLDLPQNFPCPLERVIRRKQAT